MPGGPLEPGSYIHFTDGFLLTPELDCIFVVPVTDKNSLNV